MNVASITAWFSAEVEPEVADSVYLDGTFLSTYAQYAGHLLINHGSLTVVLGRIFIETVNSH